MILQAEGDSRGDEAQSHFSPSPFKVPGPSNRTETPEHRSEGIALSLATCGFLRLLPGLRHSHREVTAQAWDLLSESRFMTLCLCESILSSLRDSHYLLHGAVVRCTAYEASLSRIKMVVKASCGSGARSSCLS